MAAAAFARPAEHAAHTHAHGASNPQGCILVYSGTRRRCIDTCTEGKTCGVLVEENPDGQKYYSCNHEDCPGAECNTVFVKPPVGDPYLDCAGGPCGEDCRKTIKPGKGGKQDRSCVCDP